MIPLSCITTLLSQWKGRAEDPHQPPEYRFAVSECSMEVQSLINEILSLSMDTHGKAA